MYKKVYGEVVHKNGLFHFYEEGADKASFSFPESIETEAEAKGIIMVLNKVYKTMEKIGEDSFANRVVSAFGYSYQKQKDDELSGYEEALFKKIEEGPLLDVVQDVCNDGMRSGLKSAKKRFLKIYEEVKEELRE